MPAPSLGLLRICAVIDKFTDTTGTVFSWLAIPLIFAICYEVISRYFFNSPTEWAFDVAAMLYGSLFMLGAAYALHKGAHIRTDFFWERWSIRTKGRIDAVAYVVFFFPALLTLLVVSGHEAYYSWSIGETSEQTPWRPLLWPFKSVVPITCFLLLVQGVSEMIKSIYAAKTGIELEHKEKAEV
jgi:TRAP-type mannitol/chloroaromatic compound transport system permease small subunit